MKKTVLMVSFFLSIISSLIGQYQFEYTLADTTKFSVTHGVVELTNGAYVVSGTRTNKSWEDREILLSLLTSKGELVVQKVYSHPNVQLVDAGIYQDSDSSILVVGLVIVDGIDKEGIWVGRFSNGLDFLSESFYEYDFPNIRLMNGMLESDSTLIVSGWVDGFSSYAGRINFVKQESHLVWYGSGVDLCFDIIPRKDSSGYLLLGDSEYYLTNDSLAITQVFEKTQEGAYYPHLNGNFSKGFSDSTYLFTANAYYSNYPQPNPDTTAFMVGELSVDGLTMGKYQLLAEMTYFSNEPDAHVYPAYLKSISINEQSGMVYVGGTKGFVPLLNKPSKFALGKYDSSLNEIWEKEYGHDGIFYQMNGLLSTSDGGCLMYGFRVQYTKGYPEELYILKVDENGVITGETIIPTYENLLVYPNPAKDFIQFDLPNITQKVSLELIDLSGRVVLAQKINHLEQIDISFLPKAMYGYRVMNRYGELVGMGKLVVE